MPLPARQECAHIRLVLKGTAQSSGGGEVLVLLKNIVTVLISNAQQHVAFGRFLFAWDLGCKSRVASAASSTELLSVSLPGEAVDFSYPATEAESQGYPQPRPLPSPE